MYFNRTMLELKYARRCGAVWGLHNFNRTMLELKLFREQVGATHTLDFNRTMLELKFKKYKKINMAFNLL